MLCRIDMVENGSEYVPVRVHKCDKCGKLLYHSSPKFEHNSKEYCGDCTFIMGFINEKEYLKNFLYFLDIDGLRASVCNGKIYLTKGKFEWERTPRKRRSKVYDSWRMKVFERDDYTCQHCGKRGGELNAHHIKPYAKYKELRADVDNGITLCVECHRKVHRKGDK